MSVKQESKERETARAHARRQIELRQELKEAGLEWDDRALVMELSSCE